MTTTLPTTVNAASGPSAEVRFADAASNSRTELRAGLPLFVPRDELFFWTPAWQEGERESEAERAAGNLRTFDDPDDLLRWLLTPDD